MSDTARMTHRTVEELVCEIPLIYTESVNHFHTDAHNFPVRVRVLMEYSANGKKYQTCWPQSVIVTSFQRAAIGHSEKALKVFKAMLSRAFKTQQGIKLSWDDISLEDVLDVKEAGVE